MSMVLNQSDWVRYWTSDLGQCTTQLQARRFDPMRLEHHSTGWMARSDCYPVAVIRHTEEQARRGLEDLEETIRTVISRRLDDDRTPTDGGRDD